MTGSSIGFFPATPTTQIAGSTDVLAGLVTRGLRAASSNPPLNRGTGQITASTSLFGASGTSLFALPSYMNFGLFCANKVAWRQCFPSDDDVTHRELLDLVPRVWTLTYNGKFVDPQANRQRNPLSASCRR